MKSIYLVEDDQELANILSLHLQKAGYQVEIFYRGDEALRALKESPPDLLILDIMLPGMDGLEILQNLRKTSNIPVLLVSAKGAVIDRVVGLELGGDDYLIKPFSERELVTRVKALFRRLERERLPKKGPPSRTLRVGQLILDLDKNLIIREEEKSELTPSEFEILFRMMNSPGRTFKRDELGECLETNTQNSSRAVDVHIGNLRKKVAQIGVLKNPFESVRGVGYRFLD